MQISHSGDEFFQIGEHFNLRYAFWVRFYLLPHRNPLAELCNYERVSFTGHLLPEGKTVNEFNDVDARSIGIGECFANLDFLS